ncbi:MAG: hypothetical protein M1415_04795 [Firmicutes bacterium]|jgi:hypothetical protein|nr:hypothetical protein [Bacillota bacterium]MCL5066462.1 hypothetical protein [Bacillota bacterium]
MSGERNISHPYEGRTVVLATKHQKDRVLGPPLRAAVGLKMRVPDGLDTDLLGTFSGEVERHGTPREVALRKAHLGMDATGEDLGLASEGSFGPHPQWLVVPANHELLAFIDATRNIEVIQQTISLQTNWAQAAARTIDDLKDFLAKVQFPSHGLIVRPHSGLQPERLFKGITDLTVLQGVVLQCALASEDGLAHVESDMRAHMNPTRQKVLQEVAMNLGRRLATLCPKCRTPGWGLVDVVKGLPCEWCGEPTDLVFEEIQGCPLCDYQEHYPRSDSLRLAPAARCSWCNP